jgi:DNA-binding SARP family transcriptional activator
MLLQESISLGGETGLSLHLMWALNDLAVEILCPRGEFREAHSLIQEAISLARSTGHRRVYGALLNSTAVLLLAEVESGFPPLHADFVEPVLSLPKYRNSHFDISYFPRELGGRYKGGLDEVKQLANQSWRIAQELNRELDQGYALMLLGRLRTRERSFAEAEAQLLDARAIFKQKNKPLPLARCLLALGNLYREQRRWDEAEICYHQAESQADREDVRCEIFHNWAFMDKTRGQYDAALSKWRELLPICRAWNLYLAGEVEIALRRSAENQEFAVYLLGSLRLKYKGNDISLDELRPQSREHLAYLAFHGSKRRSIDQVFDDLWEKNHPSMTPYDESFKKNLRQAVSAVRRKITSVCGNQQARQLLPNATEGCYCFDPDGVAWVDWYEFERALDDANHAVQKDNWMAAFKFWKFADELYRGELLADWRYADWTYGQPSRIHYRWLNSLQRWSKAHLNRGEYYQGLQVAKRMLALEPTSESARELEMECQQQIAIKTEKV